MQFFPCPLLQLVRPYKAIESSPPNLRYEPWLVFTNIAGEIRVAVLALDVAVAFVVTGFFTGAYRAVVTGIHLRACVAIATDTGLPGIAGADEFVKGCLGLLMEVTEGLYC